jgi:hypothetical protein
MDLFVSASKWDTLPDVERAPLKNQIIQLVGYDCKLAAEPNNGSVDLYVWSIKKRKITDWLEIQPSGAIGVIFDQYTDPDAPAVGRLDVACEAYNEKIGVEFEDDEEDDSTEDEEGAVEEEAVEEEAVEGEEAEEAVGQKEKTPPSKTPQEKAE